MVLKYVSWLSSLPNNLAFNYACSTLTPDCALKHVMVQISTRESNWRPLVDLQRVLWMLLICKCNKLPVLEPLHLDDLHEALRMPLFTCNVIGGRQLLTGLHIFLSEVF